MTTALGPEDRADLSFLTAAYGAAVDRRDWDGLTRLFTGAAVLVSPDPPRSLAPVLEASGRDEIVAAVRQVETFARTFHHLTGSVWTPSGPDVATGRTTGVAHHVEDSAEPRSWTWHVIYEDTCVREDSSWFFARRELTVAMIEVRPMARVLRLDQ